MSFVEGLLIGMMVGVVIVGAVMLILEAKVPIQISQETGNEVCASLVGNPNAIAKSHYKDNNVPRGKLICEVSSYNSSSNILIKSNGENN